MLAVVAFVYMHYAILKYQQLPTLLGPTMLWLVASVCVALTWRPSKKKILVSVSCPTIEKAPDSIIFYFFYFHSFSLKMFHCYFATAKLGRSLNNFVRKRMFSAFQYDVYVWYSMSEHLDARTTISRDVYVLLYFSIKTSESKKIKTELKPPSLP